MSNTVVAMCDVVKMCFVGISIQIERAAVAESVALFTHCRAVQLSEHCRPSRRMHARIKNCKFFDLNKSKSLFLVISNACMYEYLARSGIKSVACRLSILKHCCSLCEASLQRPQVHGYGSFRAH